MIEVSVALGLLFAMFCGVLAVVHSLRVGRMTLLDWALLAIGGMYGLGWIMVLLVTQHGGNPHWENWINPFRSLYPFHTASALILVGGLLLGWYLPSKLIPLASTTIKTGTRGSQMRRWASAFWLMLIVAFLAQGLYAKSFGGFLGLLEYSSYIRASLFADVPNNPWSFLKPFGGLAMVASYGFFGLWLCGRRNISITFGLTLAFLFSIYILYSWLGRIGFLVFLATFFLGALMARRPNPLKVIIWGGVSFITLLVVAYGLSIWLNLKAAATLPEFLARELSFPFGSFFAQWSNGEHLFRGFIDFFLVPLYLLPSSWWGEWFVSVDQVNTTVIMGHPKGEGGVTGGIPVDLLTLGLMQMNLLGVIIVGVVFGLLLRVLQSIIDSIPLHGIRGVFEANVALKIAVLGVFYAQPSLVVTGNFALVIGALIMFAFLKLPRLSLSNWRAVPRGVS